MTEIIQTYLCVLCQEEKNVWAIINHGPNWRKEFTFLKNEYICRACANHEGIVYKLNENRDDIKTIHALLHNYFMKKVYGF